MIIGRNVGEIAALEVPAGLHFAGYLFDCRFLVPVLVRPIRNQAAQRDMIERLNRGHVPGAETQACTTTKGAARQLARTRRAALSCSARRAPDVA